MQNANNTIETTEKTIEKTVLPEVTETTETAGNAIAPINVTPEVPEMTEEQINNAIESASGVALEGRFNQIKSLIDGAKSLDIIIEDLIYFLTDCESQTINQYKAYLISLNRTQEEVKALNLMSKKQIFKKLCEDVHKEIQSHLAGYTLFNKGGMTGLLKPIETILSNYEWVVDLHFNDSVDQPKHRLDLISQIARVSAVDSKTKEFKIFKLDHYIMTKSPNTSGQKVKVLSNTDIKALNTQKSLRGGGTYYTYTAQTLAVHIKDILDAELNAIKKYEAELIADKNATEAKANRERMRNALIAELKKEGIEVPATVTLEGTISDEE